MSLDRPIRVLLADDHPTNCAVIEVILSLIDAELVAVENGAQAVDAFKTAPYDVVLMDLQMPVMDGLTAIREIRRLEAAAGAPSTPILVVSANTVSDYISAARDAGAQAHIAKPVAPNALLQAIEESLTSPEPESWRVIRAAR